MLSGFGIGIRLALSEYPPVKITCAISNWIKQKRIEIDCARLGSISGCRVIEKNEIIHRYVWDRGTQWIWTACSSFVAKERPVEISDYSKKWCSKCWPGMQKTINKYRLYISHS